MGRFHHVAPGFGIQKIQHGVGHRGESQTGLAHERLEPARRAKRDLVPACDERPPERHEGLDVTARAVSEHQDPHVSTLSRVPACYDPAISSDCLTITSACLIEAMSTRRPL